MFGQISYILLAAHKSNMRTFQQQIWYMLDFFYWNLLSEKKEVLLIVAVVGGFELLIGLFNVLVQLLKQQTRNTISNTIKTASSRISQ